MRLTVLLVAAMMMAFGNAAYAQPAPAASAANPMPAAPAANPADVSSPEAITAALYDTISGPAGQKRNWNRFRSLFVPGGRMIPTTPPTDGKPGFARVLSPDEYIEVRGSTFEQTGFFERQISSTNTARFGGVMHVFSTYEARRAAHDTTPLAQGINSFQLFHDGSRWWIVSVFWQSENPALPLPAEFLPK